MSKVKVTLVRGWAGKRRTQQATLRALGLRRTGDSNELPDTPSVLIDAFIAGAQEVDVDVLADGERAVVAGVMEHIEGAGIHSGDSACITPPVGLSEGALADIQRYSLRLAEAIGVRGLLNIQYVIRDDEVLAIEANPRASRTVPYLSKAIGHPLAKYAALIAAGRTLDGPHLTDLQVVYAPKNMPARDASTGEQKALLIGLVLAHATMVAEMTGIVPLLLLDEVVAHLDPNRRKALFDELAKLGAQVWMTGADPAAFVDIGPRGEIFDVESGRATRRG